MAAPIVDIDEHMFSEAVADGSFEVALGHFVKIFFSGKDFDATLGFPGEGPGDGGLVIPQAAWTRMRALDAEGGEAVPDTFLDDDERSIISCDGLRAEESHEAEALPTPSALPAPFVPGAGVRPLLFHAPPPSTEQLPGPSVGAPAPLLLCPFCSGYNGSELPRALMAHIGRSHGGETIHAGARDRLCALSRGVCSTEGCGHLRVIGSPVCPRCQCRSAVRPLQEGDVVPMPAGARAAEALTAAEPLPDARDLPKADVSLPFHLPVLPVDFLNCIRKLPATMTILKIPPQCCARLCEITATNVEHGNANIDIFSALEEANPKLLLGRIPKGTSKTHEVKLCMSLWDLGDFNGLLSRIEAQHRQWQKARLQRRDADGRGHIRARARQGTRNGVHKKSAQRVTSYVDPLSVDEELRHVWAA